MKLSISRKFLLIVTGIIMVSTLASYLIFHSVIKDRYTQNFTNEMKKAELVLSNYLESRFTLLNLGIEILLSAPRFLASIAEGDPQTAQDEISSFRHLVKADFLIIVDTTNRILAMESKDKSIALDGLELHRSDFGYGLKQEYSQIGGTLFQLISTSINFPTGQPIGKLIAGYSIDKTVIEKISQLTGCETAVVSDNKIIINTRFNLNFNRVEFGSFWSEFHRLSSGDVYTYHLGDEDFLLLPHFLNNSNTAITLARSLSEQLNQAMEKISLYLFLLLIGTFILSIITISYFTSRNLSLAVDRLVNAARRISRGDLKESIQPMNKDELGFLAECFDEMRHELIKSRDELERAQEERLHADRLATIGKLTSGMIDNEEQKVYASKIKDQVDQMVNSTQEILEYSEEKNPYS